MNNGSEAMMFDNHPGEHGIHKPRTTIGIKNTTKKKLDKNKAPGQCYDGFICQMVDLWERRNGK